MHLILKPNATLKSGSGHCVPAVSGAPCPAAGLHSQLKLTARSVKPATWTPVCVAFHSFLSPSLSEVHIPWSTDAAPAKALHPVLPGVPISSRLRYQTPGSLVANAPAVATWRPPLLGSVPSFLRSDTIPLGQVPGPHLTSLRMFPSSKGHHNCTCLFWFLE